MTDNNNGNQIPYGLYYLTSDDCLICESNEHVERYYKDIAELSEIELGDINYVNLSHEENPTDVSFDMLPTDVIIEMLPTLVEYNEKGRYVGIGNRFTYSGYPFQHKIDVEWEEWRFDEDTRQKMAEKRRTRTKELVIKNIKAGCICSILYRCSLDKQLVEECLKEVYGETVSLNEETGDVTFYDEDTGDGVLIQSVLCFGCV